MKNIMRMSIGDKAMANGWEYELINEVTSLNGDAEYSFEIYNEKLDEVVSICIKLDVNGGLIDFDGVDCLSSGDVRVFSLGIGAKFTQEEMEMFEE